MTPRTKDIGELGDLGWLSQQLLNQVNSKNSTYDLSGEGSLFKLLHPSLIKCRHSFYQGNSDLIFKEKCQDWYISTFKNISEAQALHSQVSTFGGFPYQIYAFLAQSPFEAILNFGKLGAIYVSQNAIEIDKQDQALHHLELPIWLDYALSPELWSPAGKWIRFHERLHTQFEKFGLLVHKDSPGHYPLKTEAQWLKDYGFVGKLSSTSFELIFPWDFPLTGLVELEKILARGP